MTGDRRSGVRARLGSIKARAAAAAELRGAADAAQFVRVASFAAFVPLLMRLPLPRIAALISRPPRQRQPTPDEVDRVARLVKLGPRIAAPLVRTGCLTRGVTLFWFLRRAGLPVELCFGVDAGADVDGHCWLTLDGQPYLEVRDPRPRFIEVYRLGRA